MGSAPFVGGGFGHFYAYAPFKMEYPINRYAMETKRQLHVLDTNLADREYVIGDDYTIADIAIYTWYGAMMSSAYNAQEFLSVHEYANVKRWMDLLEARPGIQRGRIVNRVFGNPQLAERHSAGDIDAVLSANP
jgi:GST-like protein